MEISKTYSPAQVEPKWYNHWLDNKYFAAKPNPDKKPYTIVIPPPNVTGVLHMGHMLNNTIQDILIRRKRMMGYEACWVPGTDHASIATEARVVAMLKEQGIDKKDLTREAFLAHAWQWKEKYGGIILQQLKRLGASCDWDRTRFTMEPSLYEAVIEVFIQLYNKGYIYRGARMVNWDPQAKTTVSDEEVIYKEINSKLYYIKYYSENNNNEYFTIATTRPETIMGDVAICVNPHDERYKALIGKKYLVPLINRPIPIIADEAVDMEFGTGSLKITPAHDMVDYNIGLKYNLQIIDVLSDDGTISPAGQIYVGEDRFAVRKKIVLELTEKNHIADSKDIVNKVGTSERTGAVIEPRISTQWFCSMKQMAVPTLENVLNENIKIYPKDKFINTYKHWLENVQDWCISRQLWWGHRIPAWYDTKGNYVVAKNLEDAQKIYSQKYNLVNATLTQDADVLDTWFSSWLWPISVFDGFAKNDNKDFKYFYPTHDLVTAPEILFFWVARMIMAGYEFTDKAPFENVYLTGIVRDKAGRKMSKSLGNSPDPIELIEKYSADGVRFGMLLSSPAGNDLLFDEKYCEQGRNFANKIWNAYRLIKSWEVINSEPTDIDTKTIQWFTSKYNHALKNIEDNYEKYRISEVLKNIYTLVWDYFCSWYLEMVKPDFGKPVSIRTYNDTIVLFENLLKILHPVMPFITEEIWHGLSNRTTAEAIVVSQYPVAQDYDDNILIQCDKVFALVTEVRNLRSSKGVSPKEVLELEYYTMKDDILQPALITYENIIKKLCNLSYINQKTDKLPASNFVMGGIEFFVPLGNHTDLAKEKETLLKELEYTKGFLVSVNAKLANEKFAAHAKPEVIENENKKKADAIAKIESIEKTLSNM
ncbi:MAG: valine--tRNA ligase [Cytophagales bacterium]|nr:valine--tRNA ligase [Cytophagales bacterium]